jgi:hypothetical protein
VEVQGYLFGEPRPASEVLGIVDRVRNRGVTGEARGFIAAA